MNGAYDLEGVIYHQHSNKLMKKIMELWPDRRKPVFDLGCGHNFYISVLKYAGYVDAVGYDLVDLGSKHFRVLDIAKKYEWESYHYCNILSLEVGEHIPEGQQTEHYLDNITAMANGGDVIMSWGVPGQKGVGHINCQTNDWVREQMAKRGYSMCPFRTKELRIAVNGCHCDWFVNTLMYFHPIPEA